MDTALNKDGNYYPQVFLKNVNISRKKVVGHIHDNLGDFFYSLAESEKKKLELVRLVFQKIQDVISQTGNTQNEACCIFNTMFTMH